MNYSNVAIWLLGHVEVKLRHILTTWSFQSHCQLENIFGKSRLRVGCYIPLTMDCIPTSHVVFSGYPRCSWLNIAVVSGMCYWPSALGQVSLEQVETTSENIMNNCISFVWNNRNLRKLWSCSINFYFLPPDQWKTLLGWMTFGDRYSRML